MGNGGLWRAAAGGIAAAAGLGAALAAGAPLVAALAALLAGFVAAMLAASASHSHRPVEAPLDTAGLPPLPDAVDLLETVDDPIMIVRNRRVLFANRAAKTVLGPHIEGVDVRLAIRHPAAAEHLTGSDTTPETRTELVGLGDRERRWEMTTSLLPHDSRLVRLTDRSLAHASEQMRTDFVANASHELRTPLATLIGFSETLQDPEAAADEKTRSRFLRIMFDEARRMQQLVDDLISLSRIEAERFSAPRETVDLRPLAEEVRESCSQLAERKGSSVVIEVGDVAPLVLGDKAQLLQLLQNLVVNGLRYGSPRTPVTVSFLPAGSELLLMRVDDQGEGIAQEHLPRLTERFYRVDPGRSRAEGGTGLGLAIVKHITQRHRGRLEIRSQVGVGTSVRVYLPLAPGALSLKSHESVTEVSPKPPSDRISPSQRP